MASCQEKSIETEESAVVQTTPAACSQPEETPSVEKEEVQSVQDTPSVLTKAIQEDEKKAAEKYGKYGNMKMKNNDIMRKRMMGGGKQYFDSGDHVLGKLHPNLNPICSPEQPVAEKLRNRKVSIPNKVISRLS